MKIGIIVYSQTGNTLSVAMKFQEKLIGLGHSVSVERIEPLNSTERKVEEIKFKAVPDIEEFDALLFAAQVQAFSLSPVMTAYMNQLPVLKNKKIICFVTMYFPFKWMGGANAILKMKNACRLKNGTVCGTGIVNWSSKHREKKIFDTVEELSKSL